MDTTALEEARGSKLFLFAKPVELEQQVLWKGQDSRPRRTDSRQQASKQLSLIRAASGRSKQSSANPGALHRATRAQNEDKDKALEGNEGKKGR